MARRDYYHDNSAPKATRLVPAVSAVLHDGAGKIILQQRSDNGYWALPGGGIDPGETISAAILREIREETGLHARIERLVGIYSDPGHVIAYSDGEVRQQFSICFACLIENGEVAVSEESTAVRLFDLYAIDDLKIHPANMARIKDFRTGQADPFIR